MKDGGQHFHTICAAAVTLLIQVFLTTAICLQLLQSNQVEIICFWCCGHVMRCYSGVQYSTWRTDAPVPLKLFGLHTLLGSLADDDEEVLCQHEGHALSLVAKLLLLMIQKVAKIYMK